MHSYLEGNPFRIQLGQYRDHLLHLKTRWTSPLASSIRFDSHVAEASSVAAGLTGFREPLFKWTGVTNAIEAGVDAGIQDDDDQVDENLPAHEPLPWVLRDDRRRLRCARVRLTLFSLPEHLLINPAL